MAFLRYPLNRMIIRRNMKNHAFGMVRNGGTRAHQGWDLLATPLTSCFAIADGVIRAKGNFGDYGWCVALEFGHQGRTLYAFYAHLSAARCQILDRVRRGEFIALTGRSGNASKVPMEEAHLHFEIRTSMNHLGQGLAGRIDPAQVFGTTPMSSPLFSSEADHADIAGISGGLKLKTGF